jgi:Nuclease A inhibitor-like protein
VRRGTTSFSLASAEARSRSLSGLIHACGRLDLSKELINQKLLVSNREYTEATVEVARGSALHVLEVMSMRKRTRTPGPLAAKLSKAFQAIATGLTLPSESDFPYKAFHAPMSKPVPLTVESFRTAVGIGHRFKLDIESADEFLRNMQNPERAEPEEIRAYALLERVMRATLSDRHVIFVRGTNVVHVRFYLVGRLEDGSLVGLKSVAIET